MMRLVFAVMMLCAAVPYAQAQEPGDTDTKTAQYVPVAPATMTVMGTIIDNMCASTQNPGTLGDFVRTHTKDCALKPQCAASGYSLYSNGRLMKFDTVSNAKIEDFLRQGDSKLDVIVEARETPDGLSLVSVKNQ